MGYYEWEWAGFSLRGYKHIQPDLLPYSTHKHTYSTSARTHIPAHINTERPDVGISWGENL